MLVGAGTVLTIEQADAAISAGAQFIVSPGLNSKIVEYCQKKNVTIVPGCVTPSDIEKAIELGLSTVKFFPAEPSGGIQMIKALAAPYHNMMFMPTGGINEDNLDDYLSYDKILACGGSWMVKDNLIKEGKFDEIAALTANAVSSMLGFELAHVGINAENSIQAEDGANRLEKGFGLFKREMPASYFLSDMVEIMKEPGRGVHGHIGFKTKQLERAIHFLGAGGFTPDTSSFQYNEKGKLRFVFFNEQINGFALHLIQKEKS